MDRNEELAESLKKHEYAHRNLASILLNERNLHGSIKATVALLLLSFESYIDSEEKPFPEWEFVNFDEVVGKDRKEKEMEAFLKENLLYGPHEEKEKRLKNTAEIKKFKKLLNDPNAAWKEIDGKGGAL